MLTIPYADRSVVTLPVLAAPASLALAYVDYSHPRPHRRPFQPG
jgi:hypothetical protein